MVDQLPNRGLELEMLQEMGFESIDDLFSDLPEHVRMTEALPLPPPQSEEEIIADAKRLLGANRAMGDVVSFLGAGIYRNYVPSSVFQLVTRGEFLTSYTPYQAEASQGTLQYAYEFQTLIFQTTLFFQYWKEPLQDNKTLKEKKSVMHYHLILH